MMFCVFIKIKNILFNLELIVDAFIRFMILGRGDDWDAAGLFLFRNAW